MSPIFVAFAQEPVRRECNKLRHSNPPAHSFLKAQEGRKACLDLFFLSDLLTEFLSQNYWACELEPLANVKVFKFREAREISLYHFAAEVKVDNEPVGKIFFSKCKLKKRCQVAPPFVETRKPHLLSFRLSWEAASEKEALARHLSQVR